MCVPYAQLSDPQSLNLYSYVENNPLFRPDPDGHCSLCQLIQDMIASGMDSSDALVAANHQALVAASPASTMLTPMMSPISGQSTNQGSANSSAPTNSRTDVVLHGREYTPTPNWSYVGFWTMDWYVSACSAQSCSEQTAANKEQTISLVESQNGGPWVPQAGAKMGKNTDTISPEGPKYFDQRWFVDGKQVQLVVGRDGSGNLIKTWQVHVTVNKTGDIPVYSPGS
jgi:hypothetical protein